MKSSLKVRKKRYAWVTWLADLLAEDKKCLYSVRYLTQYQLEKQSTPYDTSEHDQKVIERAAELQNQGFTVYVENSNSFKVQGRIYDICVAGRPDIVAVKDNWVIVEDIKTGKRKIAHQMQMLLYMLLLPKAPETQALFQGNIPHGRLIYGDGTIEIPAWKVDQNFRTRLRKVIADLCSSQPLNPTPSSFECRYCKIPPAYCSAKLGSASILLESVKLV